MTITIRQIWGRLSHECHQARATVDDNPRKFNVAVFSPLSIPHWILVRRSSALGGYGDANGLPA